MNFRSAQPADSKFISALLGELGYPTAAEEVPDRLADLLAYPKALALVAEEQNEVVGLITIIVYPSIHAKQPVAYITSLVVSSRARGKGVGSELVSRAEKWAAETGVAKVSVSSALHREATHKFYENRDYKRTGIRFSRWLNGDSGTR